MSVPLWRLLRHSGGSEHYWRLIEQSYEEGRLRAKLETLRAKMHEGGIRLTKETVEFEGWDRGGDPKRTGRYHSSDEIRNSKVKKPCAGCGETPRHGREKDKVCTDCARLIREARGAREKADNQKGAFAKVPRSFPSYSATYQRARYWNSGPEGIGEAFRTAIVALATPSSAPRGNATAPLFDGVEYEYEPPVVEMGPEAVAAIRTLSARIQEAIADALQQGYDAGQDLLMSLASGEISAKELNESTIKGEDKRRKRR